jgi:dTDP-4-dehydrorhamnose reductase
MLNILITGSNGQLGSEFRLACHSFPFFNIIFTDIEELDITSKDSVDEFFRSNNIDAVINCAAYTEVDKAEQETDKAMLINKEAVAVLAAACKANQAYMVHISTDYIFDGSARSPYRETDHSSPTSAYGRSKLAGEMAMLNCLEKGMIIRTSWLYSTFGNNFVKTILKKGAEKGELNVVDDQVGSPTYARDLAVVILQILPSAISRNELQVFHYSNEGHCSWYEFAKTALELAAIPCKVNPVNSDQYPQIAPRPSYSILDKTKIKVQFDITIPYWMDSLADCILKLKK